MSGALLTALTLLGAALTLPGTLLLLALSLAALAPRRRQPGVAASGRIALVVPAHNEGANIGPTLVNLLAAAAADGDCELIVVADNCSDDTAQVAARAGATVLERNDAALRGKGYALDYAFRALRDGGACYFVVIDADSQVDPGFLAALRRGFGLGAAALQARYTVLNADDALRTRLMEVALTAFNVVRPRGRAALGLSAGLFGNGFALSADLLRRLPYGAGSVVEDLEYHLLLQRNGVRVDFVDDATVRGAMPVGGAGARTQRARWEGGRLRMMAEHLPGLLAALLRGRGRALEPALDLLLLPLSWHLALLAGMLLLPGPGRALAAFAMAVVALHVAVALVVGRLSRHHVSALLAVPFYMVWKILLIPATLATARRGSAWVRTARAPGGDDAARPPPQAPQ